MYTVRVWPPILPIVTSKSVPFGAGSEEITFPSVWWSSCPLWLVSCLARRVSSVSLYQSRLAPPCSPATEPTDGPGRGYRARCRAAVGSEFTAGQTGIGIRRLVLVLLVARAI